MFWRLLKPILILPGTVLVIVPAVILFACRHTHFAHEPADAGHLFFWLGLTAAGLGLPLAAWTVRLFLQYGHGTPAFWDPPKTRGPRPLSLCAQPDDNCGAAHAGCRSHTFSIMAYPILVALFLFAQ